MHRLDPSWKAHNFSISTCSNWTYHCWDTTLPTWCQLGWLLLLLWEVLHKYTCISWYFKTWELEISCIQAVQVYCKYFWYCTACTWYKGEWHDLHPCKGGRATGLHLVQAPTSFVVPFSLFLHRYAMFLHSKYQKLHGMHGFYTRSTGNRIYTQEHRIVNR
jgi:hypothetical protein